MVRAITILCLLYAGLLPAQSPLLETISIEQGLSQGFVPSICQDDDGFLWFATKNGLNRYDGYQFRVFKSDPFDPLSLGDNDIVTVQAFGDFLVLFTHEQRVQLFHRKTQRFYTIQPFAGSHLLQKIFPIGENSVGMLCLEAEETALYLIDWPPDLVERIEKGEALKDLLRIAIPLRRPDLLDADLSADQKKIRLLTQDSILEYDIQSDATIAMGLPFPFAKTHQELNGNRIIGDFLGVTWVFQDAKLARYKDQKWEVSSLPFSNAYLICTDKKGGFFWFAAGNTLYGIDVNEISFNPKPTWQITSDHQIRSCFADQFANIWIGTDAHGVRKFSPRTGAFKNYMKGFSIYCQPTYNDKNHVFMGDVRPRTSNLKLLDLRTGEAVNVESLGLPGKEVVREVTAVNGRFWFITNQKPVQLTCFDPETGFKESFPFPEAYRAEFPLLRSGPAGEIWFVSQNQIARFDTGSRKFSFFDNPRSAPTEVIAAERSPNGTWWIGTLNGLYKAEPDGNGQFRFSAIKAEKNNRNSLPTNSIKSLLLDPADPDLLWIGTNGHGMSRLDISKNQFTHYTTKNGLPDDVVYGILADDEKPHHLWISTNRGLTRFSPETGLFQYYFKSDGLQDNEFNTFASYKSASGKLFFGGVNGLTVFDPKDLIAHSQPPQVRLTGLKINGADIGPRDSIALIKKDIAFLDRLALPFSQNSIVLQFAATDYTAPQRNQFAYYLEGAEPEWAHRGFEHTAQYLNLAPGTYTFRVKAANSSGVWNEQPTALAIVIYAPWYRTWWAYLMYAGLLALSLFLVYKSQLRHKLEQAEAERLKGLDEFKSRFFTNITHEFRTPLTVILGMTERVLSDGVTQSHPATIAQPLSLIKRSGENLLRLINQILDLAKLESNTLKINYVQDDVLTYLRYIAESLHSLANAQNVMLRVESDQPKIVIDHDPDRLLQIVYNLLSNAIKFTPSGGKVVLRADLTNSQNLSNLQLTVTDTGAGIPPASLPHIFDRFYQAENLEKAKAGGTGIGLALTRELVQAMGGHISVESTWGKGTTFTVKLPITNNSKELAVGSGQWAASTPDVELLHIADRQPPMANRQLTLPALLLIEDNPDVVEYLASCLHDKYQLDYAYNGRAGMDKALEMVPDLIISDVMMPEKDGFEVVETLKNDERTSHIPIVLLTAKATVEDRVAGLRRGADAYLAKPFREEELLVWVEQLIARRRQLQARYARLSAPEPPAAELALEDSFMQKFRSVLEANYSDTEFSVDALCRQLAMSRTQVHRKLAALTNRSTTEHINAFRLGKACELLLAGGLNVSEVAFQVGFNDPKYFSRLFSEAYGQTPSDFRAQP